MKLKPHYFVYLALAAALLGVGYLAREVLTPFLLAAIFAYLLDPLVTFLSEKIRLPRFAAILAVYVAIIAALFLLGTVIGRQLTTEVREFAREARVILTQIEHGEAGMPDWFAPYLVEFSTSLKNSINFSSQQVMRFFSGALSSLISFFVFLLALFYFLKEGRNFFALLERAMPGESRIEFAIVARKVNRVLGGYLLAQFSLVVFMGAITALVFALLGIRFALILGVAAGLAELLPIIGPTLAFVSVVFVTAVGGGAPALPVLFVYQPLLSGVIYLVLNQLENLIIVPQVTGRMVKLHPLLILLSIIVGGHLFGVAGFLVAVPLVASLKVIATHLLDLLD